MSISTSTETEATLGKPQVALAAGSVALMVCALTMKSSLIIWLVLEAAVFIPVERVLMLRPQSIFRRCWKGDIVFAFVNATLVNALLMGIVALVYALLRDVTPGHIYEVIASQPGLLQFVEALILSELCAYAAHRFCHENTFMWKFHALHHSVEEMDWLAAARVHPVDQVFTRACVLIPLTVLFPKSTLAAYLVVSGFQSFFVHSNIRVTFGPLRWLVATPEFHHWHHANQSVAYNTNYSQQFPWMDAMFGTLHMPQGKRPEKFGIDDQPPEGYLRQVGWSFTYAPWRKKKEDATETPALGVPNEAA